RQDLVAPGAAVGAAVGPVAPEAGGGAELLVAVAGRGRVLPRLVPDQREGDALARADGGVGDGGELLAAGLEGRTQRERVGAGDGPRRAVDAAHPGDERAVVE